MSTVVNPVIANFIAEQKQRPFPVEFGVPRVFQIKILRPLGPGDNRSITDQVNVVAVSIEKAIAAAKDRHPVCRLESIHLGDVVHCVADHPTAEELARRMAP